MVVTKEGRVSCQQTMNVLTIISSMFYDGDGRLGVRMTLLQELIGRVKLYYLRDEALLLVTHTRSLSVLFFNGGFP